MPKPVVRRARQRVSSARLSAQGRKAGTLSAKSTNLVSDAHYVQISGGNFIVAGRDVHNKSHSSPSESAIWAALKAIPNFRKIYQDMLRKATQGTGVWLLKDKYFRLWLEPNGDIKIFWGSGIPGAGKTVLASIVIQRLEALCKETSSSVCVCYIYFRYSDRAEVTIRRVLEVLVKQTLERHPECLEIAAKAYTQHLREETELTEEQLLSLLRELNSAMEATFYVLDALDEALPRVQLAIVQALASLDVKLFITSRPLPTVQAAVPTAHCSQIVAQDDDIELHIEKGIRECAELQILLRQEGPSLREEIVATIKKNAGGMFLHASLQMDALRECVSVSQIRRILGGFPSQIEDVYLQTWSRIVEQSREAILLVQAVLVWVINASRSMTLDELERAVAVSIETYKFNPDNMVPGSTLMAMCRGLVIVEEESRLVRLVHYTAREPLQRFLNDSFPHPDVFLATVCITHLGNCGFQNTMIASAEEFRAVLKDDPLLQYASEAWAFHARQSMDVDEWKHRVARFLVESRAFPAFTSTDRTFCFDILTPLHIVALYHFPLEFIEGNGLDNPNLVTRVFRQSPLIMACRLSHKDMVAQLYTLPNIQINLVDADGWSALMRAATGGDKDIVALLLSHPDVKINLAEKDGWSALMLAASNGHEGVAALLIARPDIQVNLVDNHGYSALIFAASNGHEGVVALFLARPEVRINLTDKDGWSALMWAAHGGYEGVVALFLARPEIQINLVDNHGYSALIIAASKGYEGVVALFLARPEVNINLVDHGGYSALIWGAHEGYEGVIALFLAHPEIQTNLVNKEGWSALTMASYFGHEVVVKALLATKDIDINTAGQFGETAIKLAADSGHESIVQLLLQMPGIDVTIRATRDGHTAMSIALENGDHGIVRLLEEFESRNSIPSGLPDGESADVLDSETSEVFYDAED